MNKVEDKKVLALAKSKVECACKAAQKACSKACCMLRDEHGAITVEWVALAAAAVLIVGAAGVALTSEIQSGAGGIF